MCCLQVNKLRYKDGKGDPHGFKAFLDKKKLPLTLLPQYRGNRLNIIFVISKINLEHGETLKECFRSGTACGGLRQAILTDVCREETTLQFIALAVFGEVLTTPWMKAFYRSAEEQMSYADALVQVKKVYWQLKEMDSPRDLLQQPTDLFDNPLPELGVRQHSALYPVDKLKNLLKALVEMAVNVLERQYGNLLEQDISGPFRMETASARTHNIVAEELVGMYSAFKERSPNATTDMISCRIR
jgi:hypothetical protein